MKKKIYSCLALMGVILLMTGESCDLFASGNEQYSEKLNTSTYLQEVYLDSICITYSVKEITCVGSGRIICKEETVVKMVDVRDSSVEAPIV